MKKSARRDAAFIALFMAAYAAAVLQTGRKNAVGVETVPPHRALVDAGTATEARISCGRRVEDLRVNGLEPAGLDRSPGDAWAVVDHYDHAASGYSNSIFARASRRAW